MVLIATVDASQSSVDTDKRIRRPTAGYPRLFDLMKPGRRIYEQEGCEPPKISPSIKLFGEVNKDCDYYEIPSTQEFPTIKIKSLSAKNKAKNYDDTMAYFVAGVKYLGHWYTENLTTINGREIGPGTVIISTVSEMKQRKKAAGQNYSIWRHLIADFLFIQPDLHDIERIGLLKHFCLCNFARAPMLIHNIKQVATSLYEAIAMNHILWAKSNGFFSKVVS